MISVIICSKDPAKFAAVTESYRQAMGDERWEMVGIHDARSLAEGYNRGFNRSRGEFVIFSHDDIEIIGPDFPGRVTRRLAEFDLIGVAGTDLVVSALWQHAGPPHIFGQIATLGDDGNLAINVFGVPRPVMGNIQALDGVFLAARRSVPTRLSFDAINFDGFHCYDVDFAMQVHHAGLRVAVVSDINLLHHSRGKYDAIWKNYAARFERKWRGRMFLAGRMPNYQIAAVHVSSREEALAIMNPPFWNDAL